MSRRSHQPCCSRPMCHRRCGRAGLQRLDREAAARNVPVRRSGCRTAQAESSRPARGAGPGVGTRYGRGRVAREGRAPDGTMTARRICLVTAAQAAVLLRSPLAHIHGGKTSEGAIDGQLKHAITKLAHLHFVTAEPPQARDPDGEDPERVHLVGAPGLDNIALLGLLDRAATEGVVGMPFGSPTFLVTYHSNLALQLW